MVGFVFGGFGGGGGVGFDVEFGGVCGAGARGYEDVEGEGEEVLNVCSFFERGDVVGLDFVAGILPVVEGEFPA